MSELVSVVVATGSDNTDVRRINVMSSECTEAGRPVVYISISNHLEDAYPAWLTRSQTLALIAALAERLNEAANTSKRLEAASDIV